MKPPTILPLTIVWFFMDTFVGIPGVYSASHSKDSSPSSTGRKNHHYVSHRSGLDDSLTTTVDRLQMLARITNGISLQQKLISGSISADDVISEVLSFGPVTPSQIAAFNSSEIQAALNMLIKLPESLRANYDFREFQSVLEISRYSTWMNEKISKLEIVKDYVKSEIRRLADEGLKLNSIKSVKEILSSVNFDVIDESHSDDDLKSSFSHVKNMLEKLKNLGFKPEKTYYRKHESSQKTLYELFYSLTEMRDAVEEYNRLRSTLKINDGVKRSYHKYIDSFVKTINSVVSSQPSLEAIALLFKARRSSHRNPNYNGFSTLKNYRNADWLGRLIWTDHLETGLKWFDEIESMLSHVDQSIGTREGEKIEKVIREIERFAEVAAKGESVKNGILEFEECPLATTIIDAFDANPFNQFERLEKNIQTSLSNINSKLGDISRTFHSSSWKRDELIAICEQAETTTYIRGKADIFSSEYKRLGLKQDVSDISLNIQNIEEQEKVLLNQAKQAVEKFSDLDGFLKIIKPYIDHFLCLRSKKNFEQAMDSARLFKEVKKHEYVWDSKYLSELNSVVELTDVVMNSAKDLNEIKSFISSREGFTSPETDALDLLNHAAKHAKTIAKAVEGVTNMLNALNHRSKIEKLPNISKVVKKYKNIFKFSNETEKILRLNTSVSSMFRSLDEFHKETMAVEFSTLYNYSVVFKLAKSVTGIQEDFKNSSADANLLKNAMSTIEEDRDISEVISAQKVLDTMGLNFSNYHDAFDQAEESLTVLNNFFVNYAKKFEKTPEPTKPPKERVIVSDVNCPTCPVQDCPVFYIDPLAILGTIAATAFVMILTYVCVMEWNEPDRSENFDEYNMTTPIGLWYIRSVYSLAGGPTDKSWKTMGRMFAENNFCRTFMKAFEFDSAQACAPVANALVKEHAKFQKHSHPLVLNTRIKLQDFSDDYIHANRVDYPSGLQIIMTGGPQLGGRNSVQTVERFWWMAKQEGVEQIVMLCQLVEDGVVQCDQYYPENEDEYIEFNKLTVTCVKKEYEFDRQVIIRRLVLKFDGCANKFYITHYQYLDWLEHERPANLEVIYALLFEIRTSWNPSIVHCSDGVGRTGLFGYVEMAYQVLKREEQMEIGEVLEIIRSKRAGVVLNAKQYGMCAFMIAYYIFKDGIRHFTNYDDKDMYEYLQVGYERWDTVEKEIKKTEKEKKNSEKSIKKMSDTEDTDSYIYDLAGIDCSG